MQQFTVEKYTFLKIWFTYFVKMCVRFEGLFNSTYFCHVRNMGLLQIRTENRTKQSLNKSIAQ